MICTWGVHLAQLQSALILAEELMEKAGFNPTTKERGIVRWKEKKESDHDCEICFRSYRGTLLPGYVKMITCNCENLRQKFKDIKISFETELNRRNFIETLDGLIFAKTD